MICDVLLNFCFTVTIVSDKVVYWRCWCWTGLTAAAAHDPPPWGYWARSGDTRQPGRHTVMSQVLSTEQLPTCQQQYWTRYLRHVRLILAHMQPWLNFWTNHRFSAFFIFNVRLNLNCTRYTPICAWTGSNLVKESCWKRQEATSIGAVKVRPFIVFPLEQWCTLMIACWKTGTIWNFIDGSKICDNIQLER